MREILFRGKRVDNGEWVEGYLYEHEPALVGIVSENDVPEPSKWLIARTGFADWNMPRPVEFVEVDLSTVGQYTGLKDKNGKRIFEGDIIRYTLDSPDDPTATENGLKVRTGRIFWSDWRASFAVTAGINGSASLNNDVARYVRGRQIYEYVRGANTVEVIGNVTDNPDLLEK